VSRRRTRQQLTTHVSAELAAEVADLARSRGVSVSAAVEVLLAEALRANLEHTHASLLEAAVERTIRHCLWTHLERLSDLAARAALYGDEGRRMTFQVLVDAIGPDRARTLRREIHSAAYQRLQEPLEPPAPDGNSAWPAARTPS
jgi:post-segregation antitoxin (ccd killing protein)